MSGVAGGGASASGFGTAGGGQDGGGQPQRREGGGEATRDFDPQKSLAELRETRANLKKVTSEFDNFKKESSADRKVLERLKGAFSEGDAKGGETDPTEALRAEYAEIQQILSENGGKLPLTERIAKRLYESQIQQQQVIAELRSQIEKLQHGVDQASDPSAPVNNLAYSQMENFLQQSLDQMYGNGPKTEKARGQVYDVVTSSLVRDLKELQKVAPARWEAMRRNPGELQKVVQAALRNIVPPKAMELIEQDTLKNTEMSIGELYGTWREMKEQRDNAKSKQKADAIHAEMIKVRQQIMKLQNGPKGRTAGRR